MALAVTIGSRWARSAMPVPSRMPLGRRRGRGRARRAGRACACTPRAARRRRWAAVCAGSTGMCVCSGRYSESKPRASASRASSTTFIDWSVANIVTPKRMAASVRPRYDDLVRYRATCDRMAGLCEGRVVIVTGAGRGLGRAHALEFARQGAKVVVNDLGAEIDGIGWFDRARRRGRRRDPRRRVARRSPTATTSPTGTKPRRWCNRPSTTFGVLDVLVNNAGFLRDRMLANTSEDEWDAVMRVHLKGHFAPARHAIAHWRDRTKAGDEVARAHHQHQLGRRPDGQRGPGQLLRRQGRHRRA